MMMQHGGWLWGGSILMTVAMVLFWALLITAVVLAVRYLLSVHGTGSALAGRSSRAEGLLAERRARGEIDDAAYQHKRMLLHQHR